ncbi:MAG TPA: STAS domain-containing protein [Kofleriaceae bacterium]|nr:STAS domain-containing protein [Kofleriaceae bacterium]
MAEEFALRVTDSPRELLITVAGVVSEEAKLEVPDPHGRRVVIDVRGVERMNSMGVRNWIDFMERLQSRTSEIVIRQMPPAMVSQASMITTFIGDSRVESFLSPWYCPGCENTIEQLHGYLDDLPIAIACPKCRTPMELDWDREAYLAFRTA